MKTIDKIGVGIVGVVLLFALGLGQANNGAQVQGAQVQGAVVQHINDIDATVAEVCADPSKTQVTIDNVVHNCTTLVEPER